MGREFPRSLQNLRKEPEYDGSTAGVVHWSLAVKRRIAEIRGRQQTVDIHDTRMYATPPYGTPYGQARERADLAQAKLADPDTTTQNIVLPHDDPEQYQNIQLGND